MSAKLKLNLGMYPRAPETARGRLVPEGTLKKCLQHKVNMLSQFASMVVSMKYTLCRPICEKNILNRCFAVVDALTLLC